MSEVNLGTLKATHVNIALHGHNPLLSDVIVEAAADPELVALAHDKGARASTSSACAAPATSC